MTDGQAAQARPEHRLLGGRTARWRDRGIPEAERLGFDSVWCSEAYGSDAFTPLAWWGSRTERVRLGTAIAQISARQPAATAMAAMTLDHLSGGRFILGVGASGPQVVEGWYGMPFEKPLARTREYIGILRDIWARQGPVANDGPHYPLPLRDGPGVAGLGKPLKASIHPLREDIPVFLAAEGPKNVALAAELCDGWIAMLLSPHERFYADALSEGFARTDARRAAEDFEVAAMVPFIVHDDVEAAVDMVRPFYALYFGGMGAKGGRTSTPTWRFAWATTATSSRSRICTSTARRTRRRPGSPPN